MSIYSRVIRAASLLLALAGLYPASGGTAEMVVDQLGLESRSAAGQLRLGFLAPEDPGGGPVASYELRYGLLQITEVNYDQMSVYAQSWIPRPPGELESHVLDGLPDGQTLYVAVRPRDGAGGLGALGTVASANVPRFCLPPPPAGAVPVSEPSTLDAAGTSYYLTNDIVATGTAITIAADDISFDLDGYTITYGTTTTGDQVFGVYSTGNDNVRVMNGTVIQGATNDNYSHGVYLRSGSNFEVHDMTITVQGPDAYPLHHMFATNVHDHHNTIHNGVTFVSDRHYPGAHSIRLAGGGGDWIVDHNQVHGTPQWGIYVTRDGTGEPGVTWVHHNRLEDTRSYVANGYVIGAHTAGAVVFENYAVGESRGFHLTEPDLVVHDNVLDVREFPNPEYPTYFAHGIKLEGASDSVIYRNHTTAHADPGYGGARSLDMSLTAGTQDNRVYHNVFRAIATDPDFNANACVYTSGNLGHVSNIHIYQNIFMSDHRIIFHQWNGGDGALWEQNIYRRTREQPAAPFLFKRFDLGGGSTARAMRHLDDWCIDCDLADFQHRAPAGPFDYSVSWSVDIFVRDGGGEPVPGAAVRLLDNSLLEVLSGVTDDQGLVSGAVTAFVASNGPTLDDRNDHTLVVTAPGHAGYSGPHTIDARQAFVVDVDAGTAHADALAPEAPVTLEAFAVAASRARLLWSPSTDDTAVVAYLVYRDEELVGITGETQYHDSGLEPETAYRYRVTALDGARHESPPSREAALFTKPEDRGVVPGFLRIYRGTLATLEPGWKAVALPLTSHNDQELSPFPICVNDTGTETDPLPAGGRLTLYGLLLEPDIVVGARILAVKSPSGVDLHY